MDPGGLGAVIGISIIVVIGIVVYVYDKCFKKSNEPTSSTPLNNT